MTNHLDNQCKELDLPELTIGELLRTTGGMKTTSCRHHFYEGQIFGLPQGTYHCNLFMLESFSDITRLRNNYGIDPFVKKVGDGKEYNVIKKYYGLVLYENSHTGKTHPAWMPLEPKLASKLGHKYFPDNEIVKKQKKLRKAVYVQPKEKTQENDFIIPKAIGINDDEISHHGFEELNDAPDTSKFNERQWNFLKRVSDYTDEDRADFEKFSLTAPKGFGKFYAMVHRCAPSIFCERDLSSKYQPSNIFKEQKAVMMPMSDGRILEIRREGSFHEIYINGELSRKIFCPWARIFIEGNKYMESFVRFFKNKDLENLHLLDTKNSKEAKVYMFAAENVGSENPQYYVAIKKTYWYYLPEDGKYENPIKKKMYLAYSHSLEDIILKHDESNIIKLIGKSPEEGDRGYSFPTIITTYKYSGAEIIYNLAKYLYKRIYLTWEWERSPSK